ncbi:MAG: hypothetical protein K2Q34_01705 [Alphaproteobacteria bacterium]|nr:hypothetical protein [Alphaproteobacteria bacterium]
MAKTSQNFHVLEQKPLKSLNNAVLLVDFSNAPGKSTFGTLKVYHLKVSR